MMKRFIHAFIFIGMLSLLYATFSGNNDATNTFSQLPVLILTAIYLGVLFVLYILPTLTDRATSAVLGSNALVEKDPLHDARAASARGDYQEAMVIYAKVSQEEPSNRLPWVEIAKIQREKCQDPSTAIHTLTTALESHEWLLEDAAFFMGKIAEIYSQDLKNTSAAINILQRMIETFPNTRHAANAKHKLRELEAI